MLIAQALVELIFVLAYVGCALTVAMLWHERKGR